MLILTLVATLAFGMLWQQNRAMQVEGAERARAQSLWILAGAMDWARLILREDLRPRPGSNQAPIDALTDIWATPLAEARLSSFLSVDQDNNADGGPEAFISGNIVDAQSRWNLRRLIDPAGKIVPAELEALDRLCTQANLPAGVAQQIAEGLRGAWAPPAQAGSPDATAGDVLLAPQRMADLSWLGLDPEWVQRLGKWVDILPVPTPVNLNTASREVLAAAIDGMDLGSAERLVQARQREPFQTVEAAKALLSEAQLKDASRVSVTSSWFIATGRLRLDDRAMEERALIERRGNQVMVVRRERLSLAVGPGS
jgi:general secretion pathway protein K